MRRWNRQLRSYVEIPDEVFRTELKKCLRYDRITGFWWWRKKRIRAEKPIKSGYLVIYWRGKRWQSQNLAWFYSTGRWPAVLVDHKDLDRQNNVWTNLREANRSQNAANSKLAKNNTSGLKGVHWNKEKRCWTGQISINKKTVILTHSGCAAVAHFAYLIAANKKYGEFARAR